MQIRTRTGSTMAIAASVLVALAGTQAANAQIATQSLNEGLTPQDLVDALVGAGPNAPTISNISYTGAAVAAGLFTGGTASNLGFEDGIILSSGNIATVIANGGLNNSNSSGTNLGQPGDPDLNALIPGFTTFDAAVLEFDFECEAIEVISFQYRFASEEYNEYVNSNFNDVFGFFVNGVNVALLPDGVTPVSINNVNGGNPLGTNASNPAFYVNNSCHPGPDTGNVGFPCVPPAVVSELDGFTVVLTVTAIINPGVNHIKLAIADAGDGVLDSAVFIKGGSFVCGLQDPGDDCVYSQGFWKNHPADWPVNNLDLGNVNYSQMELLAILNTPVRGNGLVSLSYQLIAAQLNQASGASTPPEVQDAIDDAHAIIGNLVVPPIGTGHVHPSVTSSLTKVLDMYNNGLLGPPKCDD